MVSLKSFLYNTVSHWKTKRQSNDYYRKINLNTVREMVGHSDERTTLGNYCFDRNTEIEKANLIEKALAC